MPAQQGFRAGNFSGRKSYLRLVLQFKFSPRQCTAQARFERALLNRAGIHLPRENLCIVPPGVLGVIQRNVRIPDKCLRVLAGIRVHADAYAYRDVNFVWSDMMWSSEGSQHLGGNAIGIPDMLDFREQDDEFITPQATDGVRDAHTSQQSSCDGSKQSVAYRMPDGIVDDFEAIHIQKHYYELLFVATGQRYRVGNPVVQQCPVRQIGKGVVPRKVRHLDFHLPRLTDIMENHYGTGNLPGPIMYRSSGIFNCNFHTIAPN